MERFKKVQRSGLWSLFLASFGLSTLTHAAENISIASDYESPNTDVGDYFRRIPSSWHGDWYQYNEHTGGTTLVALNETSICTNGRCNQVHLAGDAGGHKREKEFELLLSSEDRTGGTCWLCMLGFERHRNIFQYRISQKCVINPRDACSMIDVNRPMRLMFRADAAIETCPVSGPANFSYSTVTDEHCDTHKSTMAGCVDESRLRLNYITCPGMRMDSRVDDIVCIGRFEANNKQYFLGRVINKASVGSQGDLHRCFIYETTPSGGVLMMSADASCQSLDMDQASVKIHYVMVDATPKAACAFRPWLRYRQHNKDEESLSASGSRHIFDRHKWTVQSVEPVDNAGPSAKSAHTTKLETINLCIHYVSDHKDEKSILGDGSRLERLIVYSIDECDRGYRCVEFYHHPKRTRNQVMDVLVGKFAPTSYEACKQEYFDQSTLHFETLLDSASKEQECPGEHKGQYRIRGCDENDAALYFGCGDSLAHALVFYEDCGQNNPNLYHCYGDWTDPDNPYVHYLAVKDVTSGKKTCFAYARTAEQDELAVSTFRQHSCKRGILPGVNGHRTYNLTKTGPCDKIPWRVANLTQSDAFARYDESFLSARSVDPSSSSPTARRSHSCFLLSLVLIFLRYL